MAHARAEKARKAKLREKEERKAKIAEYKSAIKERERLSKEYDKVMNQASKLGPRASVEKVNEVYDQADRIQGRIIGLGAAIRRLNDELDR